MIKIGRLEEIKFDKKIGKEIYWLYRCDCGNIKSIRKRSVGKHTFSCGCQNLENHRKHGMWKSKFYSKWIGIRERCNNPKKSNYKNYGGRGIQVCDRWLKFENFRDDMFSSYKEELTLDRIDVNGNYCKENCRWATTKEQSYNKRNTIYLTFKNQTLNIEDWANKLGMEKRLIDARLRSGFVINDILNPVRYSRLRKPVK